MKAWVIGAAAALLWASAYLGARSVASGEPPSLPGRESNAPDALGDLECVSRDAACRASSAASCDGKPYYPLRALLTGDDPNTEEPGRRTVSFHTEKEDHPHIIITLKEARDIEGIFIENLRYDPHVPGYEEMFERAAALAVWLSADGNSWEMIWKARRARPSWTIRLEKPVLARHVKVGLLGTEYFHLTAVRICGSPDGLPVLTRLADADRILLNDGTALIGRLEHAPYAVTGALGKVQIAPGRVAGIVPDPNEPGRGRVVLRDGQVIAGAISSQGVRISLIADPNRAVPWREIRQIGCRITKEAPETSPAQGALAVLRTGDRLIWTGAAPKLQLAAAYGKIDLSLQDLVSLEPADPSGCTHRIRLQGGSSLTGTLTQRKLTLSLRTFPELEIDANDIRRLTRPAAPGSPALPFTLTMRNGDVLIGRVVEEALSVRTGSGDVTVSPGGLGTMTFDANGRGNVRARMWDGSDVAGQLAESALTVAFRPDGPRVAVKAAEVASISNSSPIPPPEIVKQVEALVAALGSASFRERESAQKELAAMGRRVLPLLEPHRSSRDPEVRTRIEAVIEYLKAGQ